MDLHLAVHLFITKWNWSRFRDAADLRRAPLFFAFSVLDRWSLLDLVDSFELGARIFFLFSF
jgi:hypothetical protein